jgi:branched-chain amino acid transport system substrate-binding protein
VGAERAAEQQRARQRPGLVPPLNLSAADHEGGGWVRIFQAKDGKFVKETEWFRAYPDVLTKELKAE